jgi:hypothetical protein
LIADILNFPVVPVDQAAFKARLDRKLSEDELNIDSHGALLHVQHVLLLALQSYWLPCYLLHVLTTAEMKVLEVREKYNCWFYLC